MRRSRPLPCKKPVGEGNDCPYPKRVADACLFEFVGTCKYVNSGKDKPSKRTVHKTRPNWGVTVSRRYDREMGQDNVFVMPCRSKEDYPKPGRMEGMKLFVDDLYDPYFIGLHEWMWCKSSAEAITRLKSGEVTEISLDAHLGEGDSGYAVIEWMEQNGVWPKGGVRCHSYLNIERSRIDLAIRRNENPFEHSTDFACIECGARVNYVYQSDWTWNGSEWRHIHSRFNEAETISFPAVFQGRGRP